MDTPKPGEKINIELMYIYQWLDTLTLSHPKKNISRDFSDGQLLAEVIKHYCPKIVDLNTYLPAATTNQKCYNWNTLHNRVLKKLGVKLTKQEINDIILCKSLAIEHLLEKIYTGIEKFTGKSLGFKKDDEFSKENDIDELKNELNVKKKNLATLRELVDNLEKKFENLKNEKEDFERKIYELSGNNNVNFNISTKNNEKNEENKEDEKKEDKNNNDNSKNDDNENKSEENKSEENKSEENKSEENKSEDNKSEENKSEENKSENSEENENKSEENKSENNEEDEKNNEE